jgi:hypothetical protein
MPLAPRRILFDKSYRALKASLITPHASTKRRATGTATCFDVPTSPRSGPPPHPKKTHYPPPAPPANPGLCPYCIEFTRTKLADLFKTGLAAITELDFIPSGNARLRDDGSIACQHGPNVRAPPWSRTSGLSRKNRSGRSHLASNAQPPPPGPLLSITRPPSPPHHITHQYCHMHPHARARRSAP